MPESATCDSVVDGITLANARVCTGSVGEDELRRLTPGALVFADWPRATALEAEKNEPAGRALDVDRHTYTTPSKIIYLVPFAKLGMITDLQIQPRSEKSNSVQLLCRFLR